MKRFTTEDFAFSFLIFGYVAIPLLFLAELDFPRAISSFVLSVPFFFYSLHMLSMFSMSDIDDDGIFWFDWLFMSVVFGVYLALCWWQIF